MSALLRPWLKRTMLEHLKIDPHHRYTMSDANQYLISVQEWPIQTFAQVINYLSDEEPDTKAGIEVEISDRSHYLRAELTREAIWLHDQY